mmetsp:Transcript_30577/g.44975  ORF Transcript_30577/g.44975 Transcript_30577/m.44975 type:complete len:403 (-) Transcript_30577:43-1251(-)
MMPPLAAQPSSAGLLLVVTALLTDCLNLASANKAHDVYRISPSAVHSRRGWHNRRNLPFISSSAASSLVGWEELVLNTRGGSTVEEETTASEVGEGTSDDIVPSDETVEETDEAEAQPRNLTFTATSPDDGSAEDPDGIPARWFDMKKGDREGAKEAFETHLAWREEFNVDTMLERPHPKFDVCKQMAPHYFAGRDPHNNIIFVQRPAHVDFELMRMNNATIEDLLLHYVYVIQYCWNIMEPAPDAIMTNVLDMRGSSFRQMSNSEYIEFGKRFVSMMSANYPGRSYKTLIINAPTWINVLYKIFKPMLRESTRQKIIILKAGEEQDTALKFYLGDALPDDLLSAGDTKKDKKDMGTRYYVPVEEEEQCTPGPNSEVEFGMREFCKQQLALYNETMIEVNTI